MRYGAHVRSGDIELVYRKTNTDSRLRGNDNNTARFAIIVSTKIDKRATRRNRIRRIVSESLRHLLPGVVPMDGVFLVRRNIADLTQIETEALVLDMLTKARLWKTEV